MKSVYSTQEGVKMNSTLDFGDTKKIRDEFKYFMSTLETEFNEEFKFYYRVTDNGFIQLAYSHDESELKIIAQYKSRFETLKENLCFIIKSNIEANAPYHGYPTFEDNTIFTKQEFEGIIASIKASKNANFEKALRHSTAFISFLKEKGLNPTPSGSSYTSWKAKCPSEKGHSITICTENDRWACGYCRKKGNPTEFKQWLLELNK